MFLLKPLVVSISLRCVLQPTMLSKATPFTRHVTQKVSDPSAPVRTKVSSDKKDWFYHKIIWHDLNGDGRKDIIAARATAPMHDAGELVYFSTVE